MEHKSYKRLLWSGEGWEREDLWLNKLRSNANSNKVKSNAYLTLADSVSVRCYPESPIPCLFSVSSSILPHPEWFCHLKIYIFLYEWLINKANSFIELLKENFICWTLEEIMAILIMTWSGGLYHDTFLMGFSVLILTYMVSV